MSEADVRLADLAALEALSRSDDDDDESNGCPFVHSDGAFCIKTTSNSKARPSQNQSQSLPPPARRANKSKSQSP
jgi:hypothetical protein